MKDHKEPCSFSSAGQIYLWKPDSSSPGLQGGDWAAQCILPTGVLTHPGQRERFLLMASHLSQLPSDLLGQRLSY